MRPFSLSALRALSLFALIAAPAGGQPRQLTLGPPEARIDRGFSRINGAAELADGRLVIADPTERAVYVLDFARRTGVQLGRSGDGPNEYQTPFRVLRAPGDTLIVASSGGRFLRVAPAGTLAGSIQYTLTPGSGGLSVPHGIDAQGRYYWSSDFVLNDPQTGLKRNRTPSIKRWSPGGGDAVVVATYADHAVAMHAHRFHPYAERDAWVVAPDGRIGIVVAADYHLRWVKDGKVVSEGAPIPFTRIAIGGAERDAFRELRAMMPAGGARLSGPGTDAERREAARRQAGEAYPDAMFPPALPPFEEDGAWLSPRGDVWVARARPVRDSVPMIDVLDQGGVRRASLRLPVGRRVLALDRRGVYLVHTDDDGLQWVERYAWPAELR